MTTLNASTYASREEAKQVFLRRIDDVAAQARTLDAAQAEIYRQKVSEAVAGGGSLLSAEAEATGAELGAVCAAVEREHCRRQAFVHAVEIARMRAKADVRKALSAAAMHRLLCDFRDHLKLIQ